MMAAEERLRAFIDKSYSGAKIIREWPVALRNNALQREQMQKRKFQMTYTDHSNILKAAAFAAEKHSLQRRKDKEASPYINHPIAVATVLAVEAGINDEVLLMAALLHDTVEDTKTTFQDLEEKFGKPVRGLVEEVTDDKSLDKQVRKNLQIKKAPKASDAAKQLKIADKICNLRDIAKHPPSEWSIERKKEYLEWTLRVVDGCRGINSKLDTLYDMTLTETFEALGIKINGVQK